MGRPSKLIIKESLEELKAMHKKATHPRIKLRLKSLIYTQEKKYKTQTILALHLGVDYSSLKRWFKIYKEEGITSLLSLKPRRSRKSIITEEIHRKLCEKLHDATHPLKGYWEAQHWIKATFGLAMKYNTVRTYLIRHFKTKLKTPRKSHYKKEEQALESFLKNFQPPSKP